MYCTSTLPVGKAQVHIPRFPSCKEEEEEEEEEEEAEEAVAGLEPEHKATKIPSTGSDRVTGVSPNGGGFGLVARR